MHIGTKYLRLQPPRNIIAIAMAQMIMVAERCLCKRVSPATRARIPI